MFDSYILTITSSLISVEERNADFTEPLITLYWRFPQHSFACLCGTTLETTWICDDFHDTLMSNIDLSEFTFPDSGQICYPRSSSGHHYDMPARYFFYDEEQDFDRAGTVLETYTTEILNNYTGVGITLMNWRNKCYRSWLFD